MVDRDHPLPVVRQCELLDLPRSTYYHVPKLMPDEELALMALIDLSSKAPILWQPSDPRLVN
jgi:putative transposase